MAEMTWQSLRRTESAAPRVAVIGASLLNSLLPDILQAGLRSTGGGEVVPIELTAEEFDPCVHHLQEIGFRGISVGHPYKVAAARVAERFFVVAHAMGVANALSLEKGIFAQNNELTAIQDLVRDVSPTQALVMGAGSGARSVAAALMDLGWHVRLWNRNGMRSRLLQTTLKRFGEIEIVAGANPTGCDMIVNATSLGQRAGEKPPVDWTYMRRGTVVMDLVYRRVPTELLRDAKLRGLRTIDGRQIVVEKAALSLEWWLGASVPREPMLAAAGLKTGP